MKKIFSNVYSSQFIIYGLIALLIYVIIPDDLHVVVSIVKNLFNAVGSILIVGGIFEVAFKDKFIKEVSTNFVKTIFMQPDSLDHFKNNDLIDMKESIQKKLLQKNNGEYSKKIINMINNSFFKMAQGEHKNSNFNKYFQYYNSILYVKKRKKDSCVVEIDYEIKYEIINNCKNDNGVNKEAKLSIFSKRFFPLALSQEHKTTTQELLSLRIKVDNQYTDYSKKINNKEFQEQLVDTEEKDNVKIQEDIKRQIQFKNETGQFEEFEVEFKDSIVVEKKLKIFTTYNDIAFSHIFKRPTMNYSIIYTDENVTPETKDYLTLRLYSGLNKKTNDKIHPVLKGKMISLNVSEGVLLPGEGVSIVALRDKFLDDCKSKKGKEK